MWVLYNLSHMPTLFPFSFFSKRASCLVLWKDSVHGLSIQSFPLAGISGVHQHTFVIDWFWILITFAQTGLKP
jgi:hypothetical protein